MNARTTGALNVFKGNIRAGELARTAHGARFTYVSDYLARNAAAVAFKMPLRREPYEVFGTNLHPFFANLLPEGLRLRALVKSVKTSEDDLFSLLVASGADTIGDVVVNRDDELPRERAPIADTNKQQTFSYLIANGDMHAKNVSVRTIGARVELTPCYDLLSTLPYGDRSLALSIDGRDDKLKRAHLIGFGERIGLRRAAVEPMIDGLTRYVSAAVARLGEIGLPAKRTDQLQRLMQTRLEELAP